MTARGRAQGAGPRNLVWREKRKKGRGGLRRCWLARMIGFAKTRKGEAKEEGSEDP